MAITDPLQLAHDVSVVDVAGLPASIRGRIGAAPGARVVMRPRVRSWSKLLDEDAAALLEEFRSPTTIAEGVLRFSDARGLEAAATLDRAYPLLRRLLHARILVSTEEGGEPPVSWSFEAGDEIDELVVVSQVKLMEDTEVYQVRSSTNVFGALKLARARRVAEMRPFFENEKLACQAMDRHGIARYLGDGEVNGCPYLVTAWCDGALADLAAHEARRAGDRRTLLALATSIARAYAELHERGVLHGDVHAGNIVVNAAGGVALIDFGHAVVLDSPPRETQKGRFGLAFYLEPECACARREGLPSPGPSQEGEQFAVAALLYSLITGAPYLDFSLEEEELMRQIVEDPPRPFSAQGVAPWPELEHVLGRALDKSPSARFPSMDAFAEALAAICTKDAPRGAERRSSPLVDVLEGFLRRVSPGGERYELGMTEAPRASLSLGAAGVGYALYRVALRREDARLLALADVWTARARRASVEPDAFRADDLQIMPETKGPASLTHGPLGLLYTQALVSLAMGDPWAAHAAARELERGTRDPGAELDVLFGRSGLLLAMSSLLDAWPELPLVEAGDRLLAQLWSRLHDLEPIGLAREVPCLGLAHGWAGLLVATLRWSATTGMSLPAGVRTRLSEILAVGEPWGRGIRYRRTLFPGDRATPEYWSGWCNGSAGMVHLFCEAARGLEDERFLEAAERCAWAAWEDPSTHADLCCGFGGRAYALLALYQATGEGAWLGRAEQLAARAAQGIRERPVRRDGLFGGEAGIAVLAAELDAPEYAAMPVFGREAWPARPRG